MSRPLARPAQRVLALLPVLLLTGVVAIAAGTAARGSQARVQPAMTTFPSRVQLPDERNAEVVWSSGVERGSDFVALYVSDGCQHCIAELARWDSLATHHPELFLRVRSIVIRAPSPGRAAHRAPFATREVRDTRGEMAAALQLRAVPTWFAVGADGQVAEQHVGQTSPIAVLSLFTRLSRGTR